MDFILNTSRRVDNDQVKEFGLGDEQSLKNNLAVSFMNPSDYKSLNLIAKDNIKLSTDTNSIVVKCYKDETVPKGMILMPVSLWSNQLTSVDNDELKFKNIKVKLEPSTEPILGFHELINKIRGQS